MTNQTYTDEELTAYLDGEMSDSLRNDLQQALSSDPLLASRLQELDFPVDQLKQEASRFLDTAPKFVPMRELNSAQNASSGRSYLRIAAGFLVGLVCGALAFALWPQDRTSTWVTAIAAYQELYVAETLSGPRQSAEDATKVIEGFAEDHDISLTAVGDTKDLTFKRAQTLGFDGRPLLQMAFVTDGGIPVALCIVKAAEADRAPRYESYGHMLGVDFVRDGVGYFFVGEVSQVVLKEALEQFALVRL